MSGTVVLEDVAAFQAAFDVLAGRDISTLTADELVAVMDGLQTQACQAPSLWQKLLAQWQTQTTAPELGAKSWRDVLAIRWRLSHGEATRRLAEAEELAPRQSLTGERLDPILPAVAAAQSGGLITAEHVAVLRDAMGQMPGWVDARLAPRSKSTWSASPSGWAQELADQAKRRLFQLDQDGPNPTTPNATESAASRWASRAATAPARSTAG